MPPGVPVRQAHVEAVQAPGHVPAGMLDQPQRQELDKRGNCVLETSLTMHTFLKREVCQSPRKVDFL